MIDSRLGIRFHIAAAIIGLALTPIPLLAQASPDYLPFDAARIGLPALTETGRDSLIEQHKQLIEKAQRAIAEIQRMDLSNAKEVIARYVEDILEEYRQINRLAAGRAQDAMKIAAAGQVSDLAKLQAMITTVLEASRSNGILGNEKEALRQYQDAVEVLTTFISTFQTTCYSQSFDPYLPVGLERQLQMLPFATPGTSVLHCAKRKAVADVSSQGVNYHLETCRDANWSLRARALLGLDDDEWTLEISGPLAGKGTASSPRGGNPVTPLLKGRWDAWVMYRGTNRALQRLSRGKMQLEGNIEIVEEVIEERPQRLRMTTIGLWDDGRRGQIYTLGPLAESEIKVQRLDRPCKS